jgi:hypothetical protein
MQLFCDIAKLLFYNPPIWVVWRRTTSQMGASATGGGGGEPSVSFTCLVIAFLSLMPDTKKHFFKAQCLLFCSVASRCVMLILDDYSQSLSHTLTVD